MKNTIKTAIKLSSAAAIIAFTCVAAACSSSDDKAAAHYDRPHCHEAVTDIGERPFPPREQFSGEDENSPRPRRRLPPKNAVYLILPPPFRHLPAPPEQDDASDETPSEETTQSVEKAEE